MRSTPGKGTLISKGKYGLPKAQKLKEYSKNAETNRIAASLPFSTNGYFFKEVIGAGSFAVIFKVHHSGYNRDFAAKMIPTNFGFTSADRGEDVFLNEFNVLQYLNHTNIIKAYDYFRYMNQYVLIFQLCEYGTLKKYINSNYLNIGIPKPVLHLYMRQLLSALLYKTNKSNETNDSDRSNSQETSDSIINKSDTISQSNANEVMTSFDGSFLYRSPEILKRQPYDPFKADVWAMGVVFFMMATGSDPWPTYSMNVMKEAIINGDFTIPDTVDEEVAEVIRKMLSVDPRKRPTISDIINMDIFYSYPEKINYPKTMIGKMNTISGHSSYVSPNHNTHSCNQSCCMSGSIASSINNLHYQYQSGIKNDYQQEFPCLGSSEIERARSMAEKKMPLSKTPCRTIRMPSISQKRVGVPICRRNSLIAGSVY
ncbi:CAMK family protein kinase [Tritrichomonas foetus]|uniref:CAMK family protein kinase n=1 Tax=Tritrichomonas foetus TaxID=1144522 RepID=A0A1J4J940_9EUKA|nr:CAMK family protein kinase [Tritrichomonas foetus]|eukprot:OHS93740.1 CAMK family protein kinase [Tritrichomonas foetus]